MLFAFSSKKFRCLYRRCPPLPIPNREVKPARADGTAVKCGRVGRCQILKKPFVLTNKGLSCFNTAMSTSSLPIELNRQPGYGFPIVWGTDLLIGGRHDFRRLLLHSPAHSQLKTATKKTPPNSPPSPAAAKPARPPVRWHAAPPQIF